MMLNLLAGLVGVVVGGYVLAGAGLYLFQESLLFKPGPPPPPPAQTEAPELAPVTLTTADGLDLVSWFAPPAEDDGVVVVYFHGNAGSMGGRAHKARDLLDAGLGVFLVGYRGYNGNPGRPGQDGFRRDGEVALDFLEMRGFGPDRRVLYGESIGSGTALPLAVERGAAGVVLEGAFTSVIAMANLQYPIFPARLLVRHPFDNLAAVRALRSPLLILHGEQDDLVPLEMAHALAESAREGGNARVEVVTFDQGGHVDLFDYGAARSVVAFVDAVR